MNGMDSAHKSSRSHFHHAWCKQWYGEIAAILTLVVLTLIAEWDAVVGGTYLGLDAGVFFYPMYEFLGESLRSGHIPMWNPHQFSGAPFAADPQSGWMYLPAMLLFTLLPSEAAAKSFMLFHLLLAGLVTYILARALRMSLVSALLAAVSYEFVSYIYTRTVCCFAYTGVYAWLPLAILGTEMAIRSREWLTRTLWWAGTGLALSQILASWLGQGSLYALLATGGYIAYRTLLVPPPHIQHLRARFAAVMLHGLAVFVFAFVLAAAGLLPRLEYNALSNLAGGYTKAGLEPVASGLTPRQWMLLVQPGWWYAGGATLSLAVMAPVIARVRAATPYWVTLSLGALILSGQGPTPVHSLFNLLPGVAQLHSHYPERIMVVFYLGVALLAGATLDCLPRQQWRASAVALVPTLSTLWLIGNDVRLTRDTRLAIVFIIVFLVVYGLMPTKLRLVSLLLVLVVFADLRSAGQQVIGTGFNYQEKVDLRSYYEATGAARFLRTKSREGYFRYFGYDPEIRSGRVLYRYQFANPTTAALMVNNRATVLGLQDIQGYDPVQIALYTRYMSVLNKGSLEYRGLYVERDGLTSPLLDLLNARYIVIPSAIPVQRTDLRQLSETYPTVYQDGQVRVLERSGTLPRAWIVHSVQQAAPDQILSLLAEGRINPRQVALVDRPPPTLGQPANPSSDRARAISKW